MAVGKLRSRRRTVKKRDSTDTATRSSGTLSQGASKGLHVQADAVAVSAEGRSRPDSTWVGDDRHRRIAARAYFLYLNRGGGDGWTLEDWLEAERQTDAETNDAPYDM